MPNLPRNRRESCGAPTPASRLYGPNVEARRFVMQRECNAYGKECLLRGAWSKDHPACAVNGGPYACASCLNSDV